MHEMIGLWKRLRHGRWVLLLVLAALVAVGVWQVQAQNEGETVAETETVDEIVAFTLEKTFAEKKAEWDKQGIQDVQGVSVTIPGTRYAAVSDPAAVKVVDDPAGERGKVLLWNQDESWVEWEVTVPETGYYQISIDYYMPPGKKSAGERDLMIDGEYPFREAKRLTFQRMWRDAAPPRKDSRGNDIRPGQVEVFGWQTVSLEDSRRLVLEPLRFYLTAGTHRLRMGALREPMMIAGITVHSPQVLSTYEEKLAEWKAAGFQPARSLVKVQGEEAALKSQQTLRREYTSDPLQEPPAKGKIILNSFGAWRWRFAGDWAEWVFDVPEDGLYELDLKVWQGWEDGLPVYRRLFIDGQIPFQEANSIPIPFNRKQQIWRVGAVKEDDEPYLFALTKGRHVLRLEVSVGPLAETVRTIEEVSQRLSVFNREVVMVTGPQPDPNFEYRIETIIPDLIDRLNATAALLENEIEYMTKAVGRRPAAANTLAMVADQLRAMAQNPDMITKPGGIKSFGDNQTSLSQWSLSLQNKPLEVDWVAFAPPGQKWPRAGANALDTGKRTASDLIASFGKDYGQIGDAYEGQEALKVWVGRGREWAEIIKQMADDDFTPKTGIPVNINILPAGAVGIGGLNVMLLAAVTGDTPDVALGAASNLPVEFAMRGQMTALDEFPDYEEVRQRFRPGALIPFYYQGHVYGLPEQQDFQMLFYRIDVLQILGLKVPNTWQEVYEMIPDLQANGLDFFYPSPLSVGDIGGFTPFLYQLGGDYYTPDGLKSALYTPEAQAAFKEWTELWTNYKVPMQADFYNRMRTGLMPIGVAGYGLYTQLATAAPELAGWWGMAPLPGHVRDGQIDRTTAGGSLAAIIFKIEDPERRQQAWEFVKWWTSEETQMRFGNEVEGLLGAGARWNTANVEAMKGLPWPNKDLRAILEQWSWLKEVPVVLGGYFTGRHVSNAWNRTVISGELPRESLELAIKDIDRELLAKQQEFGMTAETAKQLYLGEE